MLCGFLFKAFLFCLFALCGKLWKFALFYEHFDCHHDHDDDCRNATEHDAEDFKESELDRVYVIGIAVHFDIIVDCFEAVVFVFFLDFDVLTDKFANLGFRPDVAVFVNGFAACSACVSVRMRFEILCVTVVPCLKRCRVGIVFIDRLAALFHILLRFCKPFFKKLGVGIHVDCKINGVNAVFELNRCVVRNDVRAEIHVVDFMN